MFLESPNGVFGYLSSSKAAFFSKNFQKKFEKKLIFNSFFSQDKNFLGANIV
jgi:hypothetical protein